MFKILFKVTGSFSEIKKLVSSANKVADSGREESQRSLTYTVKNKGPTIEPCGTPQRILQGTIYILAVIFYKLRSLIKIAFHSIQR